MPPKDPDATEVPANSPLRRYGEYGEPRTPGPLDTIEDPWVWQRIGYVKEAWEIAASRYVIDAIKRHTTEDFQAILQGLLVGILAVIGALIVATGIGAVVGGLLGSVVPGAGTAAGAGIGARLGFSIGLKILNWLGVAFLIAYVVSNLYQVGDKMGAGIKGAWNSAGSNSAIDLAARDMADSIGIFFSLLLQAILMYILKAAQEGQFAGAMKLLRESRLFKMCRGLEAWLAANFTRLMFRYKIKSGIKVIPGGGAAAASTVAGSLAVVRGLLTELLAGGRPRFNSIKELDRALRARGFRLKDNSPWGPKEPDARQLIYEGPNNIIVKVKTRGYAAGPRAGRGTMSVEVTDGKGTGWDNTLFKLDANGNVIAKNLVGQAQVVETAEGFRILTPDGKLRPISPWEVLEGGGVKPANKDAFADRGHLDFLPGFDPAGADLLR